MALSFLRESRRYARHEARFTDRRRQPSSFSRCSEQCENRSDSIKANWTGRAGPLFVRWLKATGGGDEKSLEFKAREWLLADGGETGVETEIEEEGDAVLESESKRQLVLVVDDLEDMRNLIARALKKRGYRA